MSATYDFEADLLKQIAARKLAAAEIRLAIANGSDPAAMNEKHNCLREIWGDLSLDKLLVETLEGLTIDQAKLINLLAEKLLKK